MMKRKITVAVSVLIFPALFAGLASAEEFSSGKNKAFLEHFGQYVQEEIGDNVPGYALAVVLNGEVTLIKTAGVKKSGTKDKIDENTVFRIASVSKTFASAAAAVMVQKNLLAWDSRVKPYLKGVSFKNTSYAQQLRIHHLLSHSSGMVQHAYTNLVNQNINYQEIQKLIKDVNFVCQPGECYGYQNVIYSLIGDVLEYLSEEKYETFVGKNLFVPLKMNNASFGLDAFTENKNTAAPHVRRNDQWQPVKVKPNFYTVAPAAGVNASISDMSKWLLAQLGKRQDVLSKELLDNMHTRRIKTSKSQAHYGQWENLDDAYYGLGWRVFDYRGQPRFVHHGGWVQGFRTEMVFNPDLDMGMVLMVNAQGRNINKVVPAFLDMYIEQGFDKPGQVVDESVNAGVTAVSG
jgi:beta-lactamase class C